MAIICKLCLIGLAESRLRITLNNAYGNKNSVRKIKIRGFVLPEGPDERYSSCLTLALV